MPPSRRPPSLSKARRRVTTLEVTFGQELQRFGEEVFRRPPEMGADVNGRACQSQLLASTKQESFKISCGLAEGHKPASLLDLELKCEKLFLFVYGFV